MRRPARGRDRRRQLGGPGGRVLQRLRGAGHDARPRRLADQVDVAVPDRADRADPATSRSARARRRSRPRARTAHLSGCVSAAPAARRPSRSSTPASCSSARRPAPTGSRAWSRATSGASSSPGPTCRAHGWPLDRDPYALETSVPGVFVAGRRSRALDQARRERRRRGVDGRLADPRVPRERMSEPERPTLEELRPIDLFDELDDERARALARGGAMRELPGRRARRRAGRDRRVAAAARRRRPGAPASTGGPARADQPPDGADLDRRDHRRSPSRPRAVSMRAVTDVPDRA